jgi:hypothetical protein
MQAGDNEIIADSEGEDDFMQPVKRTRSQTILNAFIVLRYIPTGAAPAADTSNISSWTTANDAAKITSSVASADFTRAAYDTSIASWGADGRSPASLISGVTATIGSSGREVCVMIDSCAELTLKLREDSPLSSVSEFLKHNAYRCRRIRRGRYYRTVI